MSGYDVDPLLVDALEGMDAEALRGLIIDLVPWMEDQAHDRLMNEAIERAARSGSNWKPTSPSDSQVAAIEGMIERASAGGYAEPTDVDDALRAGSNAFLAKDYPTAQRIFAAVLPRWPPATCTSDSTR